MAVMDIGAHHGPYSLLAAKCVGESGCVRSFEPSSRERKYLKQNLAINHCHNVTVEGIALGSRAGWTELFVVEGDKDGLQQSATTLRTSNIAESPGGNAIFGRVPAEPENR
jgi:FkbM family methyltransferase